VLCQTLLEGFESYRSLFQDIIHSFDLCLRRQSPCGNGEKCEDAGKVLRLSRLVKMLVVLATLPVTAPPPPPALKRPDNWAIRRD